MEYNYGIANKSMTETITTIYEEVCKVLTIHCKINFISMGKMHSMGYNGFKRWHRYRSRQFHELKMCLSNELFDKFRITMTPKDYEVNYNPSSMEEHLKSWDKVLLEAIEQLGTLNKEYFSECGCENEIIKCALHKMTRDYEKTGRLLKRFNESDWLTLDMHIVDDRIHEKYKCKEEKHGYKY